MTDEAEFGRFVAERYRPLVRTAFLLVGDRGHAEDLVQAALLRTHTHWHGLRNRDAAEAYTRTTMVRLAGRWSRRKWRGEVPSTDFGTEPVADPVDNRAEALDLHAVLGRLPWQQRAVLVLRYFDDLSEAETATLLRCSVGTVKSRASRALAALREHLDTPDQTEESNTHG